MFTLPTLTIPMHASRTRSSASARNLARLLAAWLLSAAAGCGESNTASVSGTITLNGAPLPDAMVTFHPVATSAEERMSLPASSGKTDVRGQYTLAIGATGEEGAVVGKHTVHIAMLENVNDAAEDADVAIASASQSTELPEHDFSHEVKPGNNVDVNFDLLGNP